MEAGDDGLTLTVTFLGKAPHGLCPENIRIDGGRRITGIEAVEVTVEREEDPELDDRLLVTLDRTGDTSRYRLSVVGADPYGRPGTEPFPGFDQRYAGADFEFRPDCPTPFDCADDAPGCDPAPTRDARHRLHGARLRLDPTPHPGPARTDHPRLGGAQPRRPRCHPRRAAGAHGRPDQLPPGRGGHRGVPRHRPQAGLGAQARTPHRLPDARRMQCRALVTVEVTKRLTLLPGTFRFASVDIRTLGPRDRPDIGTVVEDRDLAVLAERGSVEVFEPVVAAEPAELRPAHNTIRFWTWGDEVCALPRARCRRPCGTHGPTGSARCGRWIWPRRSAAVRGGTRGAFGHAGRRGPRAPAGRTAHLGHPGLDKLTDQPVLEVTWARQDALAFPVCLSTRAAPDCEPVADVSVARAMWSSSTTAGR
ncbi:hypothetical protein NKH18_40905 [Streptomyces sp. M10(2022)]